jgi:hypothetical protein
MQYRIIALVLAVSAACSAQMTKEQKVADFLQLASTYAVNYGPAQWKRDALHVDILNISDWLSKAANSADDLAFYEVCVAYVASLNDAHDAFEVPSDFEATLGFYADIYDGKLLIDSIDRTQLSGRKYPFVAGDELVSIDGTAAADLLNSFLVYATAANDVSTHRFAAQAVTDRLQVLMPHAHQIGDTATVVINQQNGGPKTYTIPWVKTGTPLTFVGPVISPFLPGADVGPSAAPGDYMAPLRRLRNLRLPASKSKKYVVGYDATKPIFDLPSTFQVRMGTGRFDLYYTGTFAAQGLTIGYLRIPDFGFEDTSGLEKELAYMQANTDGLIVDVMRNPGGDGCAAEDTVAHLIPAQFRSIGLEIRATRGWVVGFAQALQAAQDFGASDTEIQQLQALLQQVEDAYATPSGRTPALPICGPSLDIAPAMDKKGNNIAYTKPIMVLTDETTASAAEWFAATMQDNQRALFFGSRTMGAGGNVNDYPVTTYSFASATVTESLMSRSTKVITPDFPSANYIENIGVRPDVQQPYMTVDNLTNRGATFVQAFSDAMVQYINSKKQ